MACLRNLVWCDRGLLREYALAQRAEEARLSQTSTGRPPTHTAERATRTLEGLRADPPIDMGDPFSPPPLLPDPASSNVSLNVVRTPRPSSDPGMPSLNNPMPSMPLSRGGENRTSTSLHASGTGPYTLGFP